MGDRNIITGNAEPPAISSADANKDDADVTKYTVEMIEDGGEGGELKKPLETLQHQQVEVTEADVSRLYSPLLSSGGSVPLASMFADVGQNKRLRRKFDKRILPLLTWVYLLQILDKFV